MHKLVRLNNITGLKCLPDTNIQALVCHLAVALQMNLKSTDSFIFIPKTLTAKESNLVMAIARQY